MLHLYRRLLELRRQSAALTSGDFTMLEVHDGVLAYHRTAGSDRVTVAVNFTGGPVEVGTSLGGGGDRRVALSSDREGEGAVFTGSLGPDQAVILVD